MQYSGIAFFAILQYCCQFIGLAKIFEWKAGKGKPQITCNDIIKNFQERNFLWGKDIAEWKIWSRSLLALNQDFGKGREN